MQSAEHHESSKNPTKKTVLRAIREFLRIGEKEFLQKYTRGRAPESRYLLYNGERYPLKALFAASHTPPVRASLFNSNQASYRFRDLGFDGALKIDEEGNEVRMFGDEHNPATARQPRSKFSSFNFSNEFVREGKRLIKEISALQRNKAIVEKAKQKWGCVCQVCGFDFERVYGDIGKGFIEAHHIEPLAGRNGKSKHTSIDDFAMLCANCHRMIHRKSQALTLEELQKIVRRRR